ncbi:MAG: 2-oxo acid dehydrogenase subunit E2 [Chloroflexi bacterium]|nr:MAG: 2-oxo acid dehydrogenase subunit E2 [Chloroflexota bacterium]
MDEGRIVAWRKREGDRVRQGEILFEVETDKATMEVEAPAAGTLRRILVAADASAPVASVIALITTTADEPLPADVPTSGSPAPAAPKPSQRAGAQPSAGLGAPGARGPSVPPSLGSSSMSSSPPDGERVRSSPAARKRAQELGVDIARVAGTGPGGRVTLEDVEGAKAAPLPSAAADGEHREPLSRMRKAIAERMSRSWREAPQFSVSRDVDMTSANAARKKAGASYTDAIVAAAAKALAAHPRFRARFDGGTLVREDGVHVGIAVAVEDGLLVPVVRDADRKDLAALAKERERLEQHAHAGKLTAEELTGGVFSVSNLGTLGVDRFTAIVNPPEAAILAVGRVSDRVIAQAGQAVVRPVATLTLSVDHRVADGAAAARFLDDIAKALEAGVP